MNNRENGGILLYLMQEGRGIGLSNKIKAYAMQQKDEMDTVESNHAVGFSDDDRNFLPAATMLKHFGIKNIDLLSNNPKKSKDLENFGIMIHKMIPTYYNPNEHNKAYLDIKKEKMGHIY